MGNFLGGSDAEGRQRATQAMLTMKKIDLAAMEKAYLGL
jgi:predicted 3-demethylubiquinone-9 3-methyltransferase (glyoxalase superfamily)